MIIVFKPTATVEDKFRLKAQLESRGYQIHASEGVNASLFGVVGDTSALVSPTTPNKDAFTPSLAWIW